MSIRRMNDPSPVTRYNLYAARVFTTYVVIWAILVGTVFWMEPVLIGEILKHGHFGLGEVSLSAYLTAVFAWMLPLIGWQVFALCCQEEIFLNDLHLPEHAQRMRRNDSHLAYDPLGEVSPRPTESFSAFTDGDFTKFALVGVVIVGVVTWLAASAFSLLNHIDPAYYQEPKPLTMTVVLLAFLKGALVAYLLVATVVYLFVFFGGDTHSTTMRLPWGKRWTWIYLLVTAPMAAYHTMGLVRLAFQSLRRSQHKDAATPPNLL